MTALEFLARLQQLPSATRLRLPHVAAMLEMLIPVLARPPIESVEQRERWTNEVALARWLGEPVSTVESWRFDSSGARQYRLRAVLAWLDDHLIPLERSDASTDEEAGRIVEACWTDQIPALVVDGHLIGFFRSLNLETEPQGYAIVLNDDVRALETAKLTPANYADLVAHYHALADFARQLSASPLEARATWNRVRTDVSPDLALQFFFAAIGRDHAVAMEIVSDLDDGLLRKRWHLGSWLWELLLNHEFSELDAATVASACVVAISRGIDLNAVKQLKDSRGYPVFNGTPAHLLADTYGDHFRLDLRSGFGEEAYRHLLIELLNQHLDVGLPNHNELAACRIGAIVRDKHDGDNLFCKILDAHTLDEKLNRELDIKVGAIRRKQPV